MKRLFFKIVIILFILNSKIFAFNNRDFVDITNNIIAYGAIFYGAGYTLVNDDKDGFKMLAYSASTTMGATGILKYSISKERPDYKEGDSKDSFPSGHTASSFVLATFIDKRYGFKKAVPYYLLASYVGWARMYLERHDWVDILTGATIAYTSSHIFVKKQDKLQMNINPIITKEFKGVYLNINF